MRGRCLTFLMTASTMVAAAADLQGFSFDYVITVCDHANQRCPVFAGPAKRLHWSIDDPVISGSENEQLAAFRGARDDLYQRIREFIEEINA